MSLALADIRTVQPLRHKVSDPFVVEVIAMVAEEFNMSEQDMLVHSRDHRVWKPRMAAMYFARLLTGCSLPELGRIFGGRSHTTVLRAFRRCREMIDADAAWSHRMDQLLVRMIERIVTPRNSH